MVDLRPPSSLRQLFLPSSKHFCTSKIKVENLEVPKVSEEDALWVVKLCFMLLTTAGV